MEFFMIALLKFKKPHNRFDVYVVNSCKHTLTIGV